MKRFLCMVLLTLLLFCQAPLDAPAAAGEASDRLLVYGTAILPFAEGGVGFEARIGDERFPFIDAEDAFLRVTLTVSGADAKNNMLYAGETPLGALVNGENRFDVPKSAVSDGSLLLRVLLPAGSDALFDETKPYGSYNLDDIVIESAAFAYADGTEAAPVRTLLYLPVQGQAGVTERESGQASPSATVGTPRRGWAAARRRRRSASAFCSRPTLAGVRRFVRRTPRAFPTDRPTRSCTTAPRVRPPAKRWSFTSATPRPACPSRWKAAGGCLRARR